MATMEKIREGNAFHAALNAPSRSPEIPESADIYGWLIGSWELEVLHFRVDVATLQIKGEAHFEWVLEGRVVQDLWIMPRRADRTAQHSSGAEKSGNFYGTSLRVYNPSIEAWRVIWFNPVTGSRDELIGRRHGKDVVQIGAHSDGTPIRWAFSEIAADSFLWTGEALQPDGQTWKLEAKFRATRVRPQADEGR